MDISRRSLISLAALAPLVLAPARNTSFGVLPTGSIRPEFVSTSGYEQVFYVLPIDEKPSVARGTTLDIPRMNDLKSRLIPNGDGPNIRVGWSTSCWYMGGIFPTDSGSISETKDATGDYVWDPSLRTDYKLNLTVSVALPILFHLNGGHWAGASPLMSYLSSDTGRVEWDQNNNPKFQLAQGTNPNDQEFMCLSRKNTVYYSYKKRNIQAVAAHLAAFDQANPGLLVGVSLDSETIHQDYASTFGDYNPLSIQEWREWLTGTGIYAAGQPYAGQGRSPAYASITDFNTDMGTSFTSWSTIDPPRTSSTTTFWNAWTDWQSILIEHHLQDMTSWIVASGIPADRVYSHEIGPAGYWDSVSVHPSIAALPASGLGMTAYGTDATRDDLFQFAQWNSANWGLFEVNPASDAATPANYATAYSCIQTAWTRGAQIICPNAWGTVGVQNYYNIIDTPFQTAIADFVTANKAATKPGQYLARYTGTLDQDNSAATFAYYTDIRAQYRRAQTFVVTGSTLAEVDVWLYRYGNPNFDLDVWITTTDAAGKPAATVAAWSSVPNLVSQNAGWISVHPRLQGLTPGSKYAFVVSSQYDADQGLLNSYGWAYNDSGTYPAGTAWFSTDNGGTWANENPGRSMKFRTYA